MPRILLLLFVCVLSFSLVVDTSSIKTTSSSSSSSASTAGSVSNPCVAGSKVFPFTKSIESFVAPKGCIVVISLWGGGGSNSIRAKYGGGGGYIRGAIEGHGHSLYVLVGEGAVGEIPNDHAWPGQGPFYGGGGHQGNYCGHAGGGGGRTQISLSPDPEDVDAVLLIAGGGGGAGTCALGFGGSGGGRDDQWEPHMNGGSCVPGNNQWGKGGYGGRPHNEFFKGHSGGDNGGGGGGGYYGGGSGEGHCDYGSGGGGGSSYWNKDYVSAVDLIPAKGAVPGYSLTEYGLSVGMGGTSVNGAGGNGLAMIAWYPDPDYAKKNQPSRITA